MPEVIVAIIGVVVTTMVMIARLLTFRSLGDQEGLNPVYLDRGDREPPLARWPNSHCGTWREILRFLTITGS